MKRIALLIVVAFIVVACTSKQVTDPKEFVGRYYNGNDGRITVTMNGANLYFKFIRWDQPDELIPINETRYSLRNSPFIVQFNTLDDGQIDLVISNDEKHGGSHLKVRDDEFVPYEYLLAGDYENALKGYQALLQADPKDLSVREAGLIRDATQLSKKGNGAGALELMRIVTVLYPNSERAKMKFAELEYVSE